MKTAAIFFFLPFFLLCLISCDRRESKGLPTLTDVYYHMEEDFYLVIEYAKDLASSDREMDIILLTKKPLKSLKLNHITIPINGYDYLESSGAFCYSFDLWEFDTSVIGSFDLDLVYHIEYEDETISGVQRIPSQYFCEVPTFQQDQDFTVSWNLAHNPRAQKLMFTAEDWHATIVKDDIALKPSARSHTIKKSLWEDLPSIHQYSLALLASNYSYTDGGLVWLISSASKDNSDSSKGRDSAMQRILDLLSKQIQLPG